MPNFRIGKTANTGVSFLRSPYFYALALIFSVTAALLLVGRFSAYRSEVSILVLPKSESASFQSGQILENLMDISRRLSFYERLLSDNPRIKDDFGGLSKDQRKARWNDSFKIEKKEGSTILVVAVFSRDRQAGEEMARQFALSLSGVSSRFYDIQADLELRIVEGPITMLYLKHPFALAATSVAAGAAASLLLMFVGQLILSGNHLRPRVAMEGREYSDQRIRSLDGKDFFHPAEHAAPDAEQLIHRSAAPSNLPVGDGEEIPFEYPAGEEPAEAAPATPQGEPTEEEYRERLNKLLRGETGK